ncbi:hypothetical protein HBHAL_5111 [Halobacillus halophilus DSM 2266]|uniref:Uncharacterized protein n=1 Tax=Halobacillus halophilus (strain ATCC 35676 / DSM 2266 / JCM 20832 / KCTC 3685 / LMG 17431 / NBRC 102448 / NCIMB 2269) TaxID=866895 RepID=I0JTH4_HALH3|nr:hypothetical protein HBHAL_5111 [Halobacillus halophilus DSM 2266]
MVLKKKRRAQSSSLLFNEDGKGARLFDMLRFTMGKVTL